MQKKYASVKAALIKAHNADKLESRGEYDRALECYQAALELLLPMIEDTSNREERLLLKSEVSRDVVFSVISGPLNQVVQIIRTQHY
jgi:tetratricopeptide (TPR) repeat protein